VTVERAVALRRRRGTPLFNLLTNAAKFSPDGCRIELTMTVAGEHAEVTSVTVGWG
jgi:signal transduction histidine kinase